MTLRKMLVQFPQLVFFVALEWADLPAVLTEGLLRLHDAGVELAESVFPSGDTGTFPHTSSSGL